MRKWTLEPGPDPRTEVYNPAMEIEAVIRNYPAEEVTEEWLESIAARSGYRIRWEDSDSVKIPGEVNTDVHQ